MQGVAAPETGMNCLCHGMQQYLNTKSGSGSKPAIVKRSKLLQLIECNKECQQELLLMIRATSPDTCLFDDLNAPQLCFSAYIISFLITFARSGRAGSSECIKKWDAQVLYFLNQTGSVFSECLASC